jgi:hypothetical protein
LARCWGVCNVELVSFAKQYAISEINQYNTLTRKGDTTLLV